LISWFHAFDFQIQLAPLRLVELADGQVRSVPMANFEFLSIGSKPLLQAPGIDVDKAPAELQGRVTLWGLSGAPHLNGKRGTLLRLMPGSLDRVVVRMDDGGEEVAVKFANYA
jgi:hypothetical protein